MAKTPNRIRPLLIGPLIFKAELEEGNESDSNEVALTLWDDKGRHAVVLDLVEVRRLRAWLERVEKRASR